MSLLMYTFILNILTNIHCYNDLLIKDYLEYNYLNIILFISCRSDIDSNTIDTIKNLQAHGIWTNIWDITNESAIAGFDYEQFFIRLSHSHCIVVDLECNQTFMTQISKRVLFHYERHWLMFSASLERSTDILSQQNINFDAEIILAISVCATGTSEELEDHYKLYEVYNPSHKLGGHVNITQVGNWIKDTGFDISLKQTKLERRRDLNGITFPAVLTLTNIPKHKTLLEHLHSDELLHLDSMTRFMYHLFTSIMDTFNFTIHLRLTNNWGPVDSLGNFGGVVGVMQRHQAEFCISGLRWDNDRYPIIEQTTAVYYAQYKLLFMFRHPKSVDVGNVFLVPFDGMVWLAIIVLGIVCAYIVRHMFTVENHKKVRNFINTEKVNEDSYSNTMLMVFGFIFQQGYSGSPFLSSTRILIISMLIFSVLIFQFYSSFIVGSLLTDAPKNIKTVKDLLNSRLNFGIDVIPYVLDNFHIAKEESTVKLYNKIMQNPQKALIPLQTGLHLLKKGGFVYNTDGSYAYMILKNMLTDSEKCDLQEIKYIPKIPVGPGVAIKSSFREIVKISIRRMAETGIVSYNHKLWYGVKPKCEISELYVEPVDIVHFSSALYILLVGILCSVTILVLEIITDRCSKHRMLAKLLWKSRY